MIAFDSDVLIYAASNVHPRRHEIRATILDDVPTIGSLILLPEVLSKPRRLPNNEAEVAALELLVSELELYPLDEPTARLAADFGFRYGLHAADAVHLATAVVAGADFFLTNNRKDFPKSIAEIGIIYPDDLPAVA